jgi:ankyrin repeat protein
MALAEYLLETEECTRRVFEAVTQNSLSLMKSARYKYSDIELLSSLAKSNEEGETPLAIAMKAKNVPVIKELMKVLRNCDRKICKYHRMSIIDQLSQHIPIEELIEHLQVTYSDKWLDFILQVFTKSTAFTRQDKIIALELIGASKIISETYDPKSALNCWREAMTLRFFPTDGEPLPKTPAVSVVSAASSVAFGSAVEVATMEELDLLQEDFEQHHPVFDNGGDDVSYLLKGIRMNIQALLVTRRISSQADLKQPYWLYLRGLLYLADRYDNLLEPLHECKMLTNVYLLILEQLNGFDPKLLSRPTFNVFTTAIDLLSQTFCKILEKSFDNPAREELTYKNLLAPTECINTMSKFFSNPAMISSVKFGKYFFAEIICRFLLVLDEISPLMSNQEKLNLEIHYSNYIRNFFPHQTSTVLHVNIKRIYSKFCWYCNIKLDVNIINLILKLGANPNAVDENGLIPLHILASKSSFLEREWAVPIFRALVDAESHLDSATYDGKTVVSILKENLVIIKQSGRIPLPYFESLVNTVFPLTCYCARVIRRNGIPFDGDRIPSHMQSFVAMHSAVEGKDIANPKILFCL